MTTLYGTGGNIEKVYDTNGTLVFPPTDPTTPEEDNPPVVEEYPVIEHPITDVPAAPDNARPDTVAAGGQVLPNIGPFTETRPSSDGSGVFIHPSVVDMGSDGWQGYRYWSVDTPYYNTATQLENPEILASQDGITWVVPYGVTNPLAREPAGGFNSDVEMVWDAANKRLWVVWRRYHRTTDTIYYETAHSYDGHKWTLRQNPPMLQLPGGNARLSPSISRNPDNGRWRMYLFSKDNPADIWEADDLDGPWTKIGACTYLGGDSGWHGDIIPYRGYWIGVLGRDYGLYSNLLISRDGITFVRVNDQNANDLGGYRVTLSAAKGDGYIDAWKSTTGNVPNTYRRVHEQVWWNLLDQLPG